MGKLFILKLDNKDTIKIQASQCINMDNASVGDNIIVVSVTDNNGTVLCYVKVSDYEDLYK